MQTIDSFFAPK